MRLPMLVTCLILMPALSSSVPSVPAAGQEANDASQIAGVYECRGTRPDGAMYEGVVHIVQQNDSYHVLWNLGSEQHLGVGVVTGGVFAVSYSAGLPGVVAYRIETSDEGLRLVGQWTVVGAEGRVFGETLTRVSGDAALPHLIVPRPSEPQGRRVPAAWFLKSA